MALLQVNFFSDALKRTVPIHVILPADKVGPNGLMPIPEGGFKTLYLLNGLFGNYTDWHRRQFSKDAPLVIRWMWARSSR